MTKTALVIITSILLAMGALPMQAQESTYKFDLGGGLGASGYLGEANNSNILNNTGFAANASFRYLINTRWAIRGMFTTASLSGNSANMDNVFPEGKTYEFSSQVYDLGARVEFNFFNYGIGETYRKMKRLSPYLSLGLGLTMATNEGESSTAMSIPMGVGVKYKLKPRINVGLEWSMTKVIGDNIDSKVLDDLQGIKSSSLKNTDWYSTLMLSISFEFGERCKNCYYVD